MRFAFPPLLPAVRAILVVLFAGFLAQTLCGLLAVDLAGLLAIDYRLAPGLAWQWATHPLVELPSDRMVVNRAIDLLLVYFWLTSFEQQFGARKTGVLAGLSVIAGAALTMLLGFGAAAVGVPGIAAPYAGAGAIGWAGLGALAITTRGQPMNWVLLPQMNAWTLAAVFLVITALQAAWSGTPTFLLGAIGGFAAGIFYTRWLERPPARKPPPKRRSASHLRAIPGGAQPDEDRPRWLN